MKKLSNSPVGCSVIGLSLIVLTATGVPAQEKKTSASVGTPVRKTVPAPAGAAQSSGSTATTGAQPPAQNKPTPTARDLIDQGKKLYLTEKYRPALQKFESAIRLEPQNDEALGLAAVTAFRLDLQPKAREMFQRRAQLPEQKPSVKAYCDYWSALTYWRQVHDLIAAGGDLKQGRVIYKLKDKELISAREYIAQGLEAVKRALEVKSDYAEALNVRNLLHAEAALIAEDEAQAADERKQALEALRKAFGYFQQASQTKGSASANFGAPTVLVGEFAGTPDEDALLADAMLLKLQGGRPIKRAAAVIPPWRPPAQKSDSDDPASKGVTSTGGAVSVGPGRGALFGQLVPGIVKVEVLVGTDGNVIFARQVSGRIEIGGLAVAAARKWTFQPALFEGKPVQVSGVITFDIKASKAKPAASPTPATPSSKTN
ncbi:MAG: energy transducer TonB [Blastocatellia bacterium]